MNPSGAKARDFANPVSVIGLRLALQRTTCVTRCRFPGFAATVGREDWQLAPVVEVAVAAAGVDVVVAAAAVVGAVAVVVQVVLRRRVSQLVVVRFGSLLKDEEELKVLFSY